MALALYRRYRPDVFADVIGQDQVTVPLSRALDEGRLTHAYLFSGPRGCGKTSSARILARCANCAKGPTSHPCGECDSCRDLATGGPGSLDVVEVDAASHNGVDDARDLRERAGFAPARDRYKIFILDEAHMVTQQGFNALLKIVEEPPEHVMFIFATTEPDKVIGTIRSRTHHYPFRLVPPEVMAPFLKKVCAAEGTTYDSGVLRMVMRAGGGSVRDTLSVLDQLMVGARDGHIEYDSATALMGFTPDSLIGAAVDAVIDSDGPGLYGVVEKVVASGFDPRRFVDDLLSRVRDLLVLRLGGERAEESLGDDLGPDDLRDLRRQSQCLDLPQLTSMAEVIDSTLSTMAGAVSPRMRLELLAARLLDLRDESRGGAVALPQAGGRKPSGEGEDSSSGAEPPAAGFVGSSRSAATGPSAPAAPSSSSSVASANPVAATHPSRQPVPSPASQTASAPDPASSQIRPKDAEPSKEQDLNGMWDAVLASLPDDVRSYVDRHHVPRVSMSTKANGIQVLVMTFDCALSQHAFALAVDGQGKKASKTVLRAVREVFGPRSTIMPSPVAADGEHVETASAMPPEKLADVKRRIAVARANLAVGELSASIVGTSARDSESSRETHVGKDSSNVSDDDDPTHRGASSESQAAGARGRSSFLSDVDDVDASWYEPIPVSGSMTSVDASSPADRTVAMQSNAVGSRDDEIMRGVDVWADRTMADDGEPSADSHPRTSGYSSEPGAHMGDGKNDGRRNGNRDDAGQKNANGQNAGPEGDPWMSAPPGDAPEGRLSPEVAHQSADRTAGQSSSQAVGRPDGSEQDDEYSLADRSLESQTMTLDEMTQMFQVSTVERYAANDPRNPLGSADGDGSEGRE